MMKKLYIAGALLVAVSMAGCTLKAPNIPVLSTGDVQQITWTITWAVELTGTTELTGTVSITGTITYETGKIITGVGIITNKTGITAEVKDLINERKTQPKDDTKLTEEDIGLMEQIIQKVQDLGKK